MFRSSIGLVAIALALTGCTAAQPTEFIVQEAAPTTSTTQSSQVPGLQTDLDRIAHVHGELRREVWGSRTVTQRNRDQLAAIFATPALEFQQMVWRDEAKLGPHDLRENPEDQRWTLREVIKSTDSCVYAKVVASEDHNTPDGSKRGFVGDFVLRKRPHDTSINPTPWVLQMYTPEVLKMVDAETACD